MDGVERVSMGRGRSRQKHCEPQTGVGSARSTPPKPPAPFAPPPPIGPKAIQISVNFTGAPKREVVIKSVRSEAKTSTLAKEAISPGEERRREHSSSASKVSVRTSELRPLGAKECSTNAGRDIRNREKAGVNSPSRNETNEPRQASPPKKQDIGSPRTHFAEPLEERGATSDCFDIPSSHHVPVRISHFLGVGEFYLLTKGADIQLEAMQRDFDRTVAKVPRSIHPGMKLFVLVERRNVPERIVFNSICEGEADVRFLDSGRCETLSLGPDSAVLFQMPKRFLEVPPLAVRARLAGLTQALPENADAMFRTLCHGKQLQARSISAVGKASRPIADVQLLDGEKDLLKVLLKALSSKDEVAKCAKVPSPKKVDGECLPQHSEESKSKSEASNIRTRLQSVNASIPCNTFVEVKLLSLLSPSSFEVCLCSDPALKSIRCALDGVIPALSDTWNSGLVDDLFQLLEVDQEKRTCRFFAKSVGREENGVQYVVLKDDEDIDIAAALFEMAPEHVMHTKAVCLPQKLKALSPKDKVAKCAKVPSSKKVDGECLPQHSEEITSESEASNIRTRLPLIDASIPCNTFVEVKLLSMLSPSCFELCLCSNPASKSIRCGLDGIFPASSDTWDSGVVEDLCQLLEVGQEKCTCRLFAKSVGREENGVQYVVLKDDEDTDIAAALSEMTPEHVMHTKAVCLPRDPSPEISPEGGAATISSPKILPRRCIVRNTDLQEPQHQVDAKTILVFSSLSADKMDLVWFRCKRQEGILEELEKILSNAELVPEVEFDSGIIVLTRNGTKMCRAEVLSASSEDEFALIRLIDYGNELRVEHRDLFQLNSSSGLTSAAPFAFSLRLHNMRSGAFADKQRMEAAETLFAKVKFFKATLVQNNPDVALLRSKEHRYFVAVYKSLLEPVFSEREVKTREDGPVPVALHPANIGSQEEELDGFVTHIVNMERGSFLVVTESDSNIVDEISKLCAEIFDGSVSTHDAKLGELVVVSEHEYYKRARIVGISLADGPDDSQAQNENEYKCRLLDFGDCTVLKQSDVFPWPDFCQDYPCFVRECQTFDFPPSPAVIAILKSGERTKFNVAQQLGDRYRVTVE